MDLDLDFNSFSNLPHFKNKKQTMNKTYKYYCELVRKPSNETQNLIEVISSDEPLPLFEENLCLILIDSLHMENEVVKILLSQNDYQISKVLGFKWFFKNLSSEFCIKELFPYISVIVRHKVIHKLSKHLDNTEEAQKYFEFIRDTYSHEKANYLLPRCSHEFIFNYYEKMKHTFQNSYNARIVYSISKRYPELGVQILSNVFDMKKADENLLSGYKKVIQYLSGNHPDLIEPFLKKYHLYIPCNTFGIKLTKKLGAKLTRKWFPDRFKRFLFKEKILFSILNNQEQIKYLAGGLFVDNQNLFFDDWTSRISDLLKFISEEKRLDMIESVYKEVYNSKFTNHSKHWTSEILELLPIATREPFLQKLEVLLKSANPSDLDDNIDKCSFSPEYPEQLIYLWNPSTAFEKFKEILRKCPVAARRESILTYMVKNCRINNDLTALQQLVEFVAAHHRNDEYNVISNFTNAINEHFPSSKLNSVTLEKLEELTYFTCLKRSSNDLYNLWKELHIYHRLENNMEVDVNNFFQTNVLKTNNGQSFVRHFGSKQSKTFILAVSNEITQWIRDKSFEKLTDSQQKISEKAFSSLISTCKGFNKKNKNNRIFIKDVKGLEEILKIKSIEKLPDLGAQEWPLDFWEIIFASKCNGDIFGSNSKPIYVTYIVKRAPELVVKYSDGVVNTCLSSRLSSDKTFLNLFIITASFLGITEKVKRIILNEFETADAFNKRKNALTLYSHMCSLEEFSSAVEKYMPKGDDKVRQKRRDFDQIQILIPELLKNVKPRWKNLELIFKFYYGDFLKSVSPSFFACCYHTRCDVVVPFLLKQLNASPPKISYKKNIIKLILEILNRKEKSNFYLKFWEEHKHYSIRGILLGFISKSFIDYPSRDTFQVLEKCILECDENSIVGKPELEDVPVEFLNDYTRALWLFSEKREKRVRDLFRTKMFWGFTPYNINFLEPEFSEMIIREYLFNSFSDNGIETFTVTYLQSKSEAIEKRVHFVLDLIKIRKPSSQVLFPLFRILIFKSKNNPHEFSEIVKVILENWPEYPLGILFKERILLTYYVIYYKVLKKTGSDKVSVEFGKELKTFFSTVENLNDFVFIYAKVLKKFLKSLELPNAVLVIKELMSANPNRTLSLLGILSLPKGTVFWYNMKGEIDNPNIIGVKKDLKEMFNAVESYNDKVVEVYMRSKFDLVEP